MVTSRVLTREIQICIGFALLLTLCDWLYYESPLCDWPYYMSPRSVIGSENSCRPYSANQMQNQKQYFPRFAPVTDPSFYWFIGQFIVSYDLICNASGMKTNLHQDAPRCILASRVPLSHIHAFPKHIPSLHLQLKPHQR